MTDNSWIAVNNYQNRSIPGGWGGSTNINGHVYTFKGLSPGDAFVKLRNIYKKFNQNISDDDIKNELNALWCNKSPGRCNKAGKIAAASANIKTVRVGSGCAGCGGGVKTAKVVSADSKKLTSAKRAEIAARKPAKVLGPADWGPIIWRQLNLFGVAFNKQAFKSYVDWVVFLTDPNNELNSNAGCEMCHNHFKDYIHNNPIDTVDSASKCSKWVNEFHNSVNQRIGKRSYTINQMRQEYGVAT